MRDRDKNKEIEETRRALLNARGEILGKYHSEKGQRIQWLVKFIDIEDELEELSRRKSRD
ncbi:MAG: hypothetical protein APF81_11030 [Desulfosporosinus sp. BRH_c37]|nr:MAG: hypothetical protein APF81_11030 [Desulfosporosinus sp. BRH_c37]